MFLLIWRGRDARELRTVAGGLHGDLPVEAEEGAVHGEVHAGVADRHVVARGILATDADGDGLFADDEHGRRGIALGALFVADLGDEPAPREAALIRCRTTTAAAPSTYPRRRR